MDEDGNKYYNNAAGLHTDKTVDSVTLSFAVTVPAVTERTTWKNVALLSYSNPNDPDPTDPDPSNPDPSNPDPDDPHRGRTPIPSNEVEIEETVVPSNSPQTSDDQNIDRWFLLLVISGLGLMITGVAACKGRARKQK